jgi:hypothetical protein
MIRAALSTPMPLLSASEEHESRLRQPSSVASEVESRELYDLIDEHLPIDLRADYLKLLAGAGNGVTTDRRRRIQRVVAEVLDGKVRPAAVVRTAPIERVHTSDEDDDRAGSEPCHVLGEDELDVHNDDGEPASLLTRREESC